jgi:hypothetical protein
MKPLDVDLLADLATNLVGPRTVAADRAKNVNTVDEVPDSSWYTNRAGAQPLTPADVFRGPDTTPGPEPGVWTVTSSKSDGVTPGFTIKDAKGQLWFLKFDPPGFRGMATGTEVAVTKLMWALGYHVPENHIAYMRREQLVLGSSAKFTPPGGKRRAMRLEDLDTLLQRADRDRTAPIASLPARRCPASRSAGSGSSTRGRMIPTTSCRTRIGGSCAATASLRPGSITWMPRRSTRSTR